MRKLLERFLLFHLIVVALPGCTIDSRISSLSTSESTSSSSLTILGVTGGTDITEDAYLAAEAPARITWQSKEIVDGYSIEIFSGDGVNSLCPNASSSLPSHTFTSCILPNGSYVARIKSQKDNVVTAQSDFSFTKNAMSLSPNAVELYSGETLVFPLIGGLATFSISGNSNSYLNPLNWIYTFPLAGSPANETIGVTDSLGQQASISVKNRVFQTSNKIPATETKQSSMSLTIMAEVAGALWELGSSENGALLTKSTDNAATWTISDNVQAIPGHASTAQSITADSSSNLYLIIQSNSSYEWKIRKSTNGGTTWTDFTDLQSTILAVQDGHIVGNYLFAVGAKKVAGSNFGVIVRCHLTTALCENVDQYPIASQFVRLASDTGNTIYAAGRISNAVSGSGYSEAPIGNNQLILKKSTDSGTTWQEILVASGSMVSMGTTIYTFHQLSALTALRVSPDATKIVLSGSNSGTSASIIESIDSGVNFSSSSPGGGWRANTIILSNGDLVATTYTFSLGVTTQHIRKRTSGSWTVIRTIADGPSLPMAIIRRTNGDIWTWDYFGRNYYISTNSGTSFTAATANTLPATYTVTLSNEINAAISSTALGVVAVGSKSTRLYLATWWMKDSAIYYNALTSAAISSTGAAPADNGDALYYSVAESPTTNSLIAVGAGSATLSTQWVAKKYSSGSTWIEKDAGIFEGAGPAVARVIVANSSGHFFVGGDDTSKMAVRKSTDDGETWTNLFTYQYTAGFQSQLNGLALNGTSVLASGFGKDGSAVMHWITVERAGATTTVVDDAMVLSGALEAESKAIAISASGDIYTAGRVKDSNGINHWITRRKLQGQSTWATVDDFQLSSTRDAIANAIYILPTGEVLVGGYAYDTNGIQKATIRKMARGQWHTVEKYTDYGSGIVKSIFPCLTNRVCWAGTTSDDKNSVKGVIRAISP